MRRLAIVLMQLSSSPAIADYRITRDHGGLTPDMKRVKNGPDLWARTPAPTSSDLATTPRQRSPACRLQLLP
jgi:hypothetical protein